MDAVTERIYNHIKFFIEENGYPQTIKQISKDLNISEHDVQRACDKLQQSGRVMITDEPHGTIIEFET